MEKEKEKDSIDQVYDAKEDYFSQLPDDLPFWNICRYMMLLGRAFYLEGRRVAHIEMAFCYGREFSAAFDQLMCSISRVNCFQRETEIFKNLRQLHLVLVDTKAYDIVKISPLLRSCPLLQCLSLDLTKTRCSAGRGGPLLISPTCRTELKEVAFGGFHGTCAEIEFALHILRSAMVLEGMFLSQRFRCYSGFGKRENMFVSFDERRHNSIQRQLHGQAISRKAVVIFQ